MGFGVHIDREKCNKDSICVQECPERAIEMGEDGFPRATPVGAKQCINCGHCVAFCPTGAFSLETMKPEDCDPIPQGLEINGEQMAAYVRTRRSVRTYKKKLVPKEVLESLIGLACYAPTAKNLEPVHWIVIHDPEEVQRFGAMVIDWMKSMRSGEVPAIFEKELLDLIINDAKAGGDWICRGAPHIAVAHGPNDLPLPASPAACIIALTTLELAAPTYGLGACWAGYFNAALNNWKPMLSALDIPENHDCHGAMMLGYPVYKRHRIPVRIPARIGWR
jgi:nitroreductase/NAD-dependent dihydropyrimidine dehydrogenase PreA subunit